MEQSKNGYFWSIDTGHSNMERLVFEICPAMSLPTALQTKG
jgi:hypothetical protein